MTEVLRIASTLDAYDIHLINTASGEGNFGPDLGFHTGEDYEYPERKPEPDPETKPESKTQSPIANEIVDFTPKPELPKEPKELLWQLTE